MRNPAAFCVSLQARITNGSLIAHRTRQVGFQLRGDGGFNTAFWLDPPPPKKAPTTGPHPTETDLRAPDVTLTHNSAMVKMKMKNENGIFGISASRGFRKVIDH